MGLRCKSDGCLKVIAQCRCAARNRRHWQADLWTGHHGARRRTYYTSREPMTAAEARHWYAKLRLDARDGAADALPDRHTFADAARAYVERRTAALVAGERRPMTVSNQLGLVTNYLLPMFGTRHLNTLAPADVHSVVDTLRKGLPARVLAARLEVFERELRRSGYARRGEAAVAERIAAERERILNKRLSARTLRMLVAVLVAVLDVAVLQGWLPDNPGRRVPARVEGRGRVRDALTEEELLQLSDITAGASGRDRLPLLLMAWCGLRRGEVFGLQRRDYDKTRRALTVARILDRDGKAGPVKADSGGEVPVPDWIAEELEEFVASRKVAALDGTDWLFTTADGAPLHNNQDRYWKAVVRSALVARATDSDRAAALAGTTFHCLRHSYATALHAAGIDVSTRQRLMRHRSIQMTGHYTHVALDVGRRAQAALVAPPNRCVTAASGRVE